MCWQLIPEGPYQPFHDLTFTSPAAALGCFGVKSSGEPATTKDAQGQSVPSWLPIIQTVIDALDPFEEACLAVSQALQNQHPEQFQ